MTRILTRDELIRLIAIRMAATGCDPPILRGKAAPRDAWERDRFCNEFATWFVEECIEWRGFKVMNETRPHLGSDVAGFNRWRNATPPQLWSRRRDSGCGYSRRRICRQRVSCRRNQWKELARCRKAIGARTDRAEDADVGRISHKDYSSVV